MSNFSWNTLLKIFVSILFVLSLIYIITEVEFMRKIRAFKFQQSVREYVDKMAAEDYYKYFFTNSNNNRKKQLK